VVVPVERSSRDAATLRSVRRMARIFDTVVRTDPDPAREEDSFTFLNRVATPYWERVRTFVEEVFAEYPQQHADDLRARFRSRQWSAHAGAWWELYLPTATLDAAGRLVLSEANRTGAELFALSSEWPGPEGPFDIAIADGCRAMTRATPLPVAGLGGRR
jgi:hypothetical protein